MDKLGELFEKADMPEIMKKFRRRRGRFSAPIIEKFIESNQKCVRLKIENLCPDRPPNSVKTTLSIYLRNHPEIAADAVLVEKQVYLVRTSDEENDGSKKK